METGFFSAHTSSVWHGGPLEHPPASPPAAGILDLAAAAAAEATRKERARCAAVIERWLDSTSNIESLFSQINNPKD